MDMGMISPLVSHNRLQRAHVVLLLPLFALPVAPLLLYHHGHPHFAHELAFAQFENGGK